MIEKLMVNVLSVRIAKKSGLTKETKRERKRDNFIFNDLDKATYRKAEG